MLSSVVPEVLVQFIPSPDQGVWHLGPVPIRGYALSIPSTAVPWVTS